MQSKLYSLPNPVADTESGPVIKWSQFSLDISYVTYQNVSSLIKFEGVLHFEFLSEEEVDPNVYQYDGAIELVDSTVIKKLVEVGEIDENERDTYRHIAIGFNEIGSYVSIVFNKVVHDPA